MNENRLFDIVESYREDILKTLQKWISVPSIGTAPSGEDAPFGANVRRMLDMALKDATDMGFETREFDGYAMHAQMGQGAKTMGMLCHLDVVPVGDGWTKDPWGGKIENGKLYGRGTADDKGCAVIAMYAMKAVREAGIPLRHAVRLILGCDEETGMTDMRHYASKIKMPDYGFSPDAEFPVINIEKGHVNLCLSGYAEEEGSDGIRILELDAGERPNVVPGTARAKFRAGNEQALKAKLQDMISETGFELTLTKLGEDTYMLNAKGLGSHASMPELGKNAAGMLLIALKKLEIGGKMGKMVSMLADVLGMEGDGKSLGIACEDEESGKLTCNLGILRGDKAHITAVLDIRAPICCKFDVLYGQVLRTLKGSGLTLELLSESPVYHVDKNHEVVKGLIDAYTRVTGRQGYAFAIGGGTYSRMMPDCVAFGPNFPGDTDMCHMPDEYVDIEKLMTAAKIYALAIARLAGAENTEEKKNRSIAIDGPCGAGKSTVADEVAKRLGGYYLDTGAMYRAVGLYMISKEIDPNDTDAVDAAANDAKVDISYTDIGQQRTWLNGEDVTEKLRTPEVSMAASLVGKAGNVRKMLVRRQKELAEELFLVCDGRDIGTCVITDAALKIYLTATAEERARRRFNQMEDKSCGFEAVLKDINQRDYNDMHREISPLMKAMDAVELDTTDLDFEQVVSKVIELYRKKTQNM